MAGWRSARAKAKARNNAVPAPLSAPPVAPPPVTAPPVEAPIEALVVSDEVEAAPVVPTAAAAPTPAPAPSVDTQVELLRLFEVVTTMCDHVIGYIEADRAERQLMMETLSQLGRIITDGAAAAVAAAAAQPAVQQVAATAPLEIVDAATDMHVGLEPFAFAKGERVIGGSMPAGPEPVIDLAEPATVSTPEIDLRAEPPRDDSAARAAHPASGPPSTSSMEIAVQVRGRFGDRWVDGFEICEVMTTPSGPRYRLRRQRDGVVLPEMFDASNIRHVETFDELASTTLNGTNRDGASRNGSGSNGSTNNGATGYWSRS